MMLFSGLTIIGFRIFILHLKIIMYISYRSILYTLRYEMMALSFENSLFHYKMLFKESKI